MKSNLMEELDLCQEISKHYGKAINPKLKQVQKKTNYALLWQCPNVSHAKWGCEIFLDISIDFEGDIHKRGIQTGIRIEPEEFEFGLDLFEVI